MGKAKGMMLSRTILSVVLCQGVSAVWAGAAEQKEEVTSDVEALVTQLADHEYVVREEASRRLLDIGMRDPDRILAALPQDPSDPELRQRCLELRKRIEATRKDIQKPGDEEKSFEERQAKRNETQEELMKRPAVDTYLLPEGYAIVVHRQPVPIPVPNPEGRIVEGMTHIVSEFFKDQIPLRRADGLSSLRIAFPPWLTSGPGVMVSLENTAEGPRLKWGRKMMPGSYGYNPIPVYEGGVHKKAFKRTVSPFKATSVPEEALIIRVKETAQGPRMLMEPIETAAVGEGKEFKTVRGEVEVPSGMALLLFIMDHVLVYAIWEGR
jgi:hypothetical protein